MKRKGLAVLSALSIGIAGEMRATVPPPVNDLCSGAIVVPGAGPFPHLTPMVEDISGATMDNDPPNSCVDVTHSIWYRFTPASAGDYTLSVGADTGTTVEDTAIAVYTSAGGCAGPFIEVDCEDDEAGLKAALGLSLDAGETYYIVVSAGLLGFSPEEAAVQLRVSLPTIPANDICSGAEVIPGDAMFPYMTSVADITLAGTEGDPSGRSCAPHVERSVWYEFTPATGSIYEFSTCEGSGTTVFDTALAVYEGQGGCGGELIEVACSDSGCGSRGLVSLEMVAGRRYYVVVWEAFVSETDVVTLSETSVQLRVNRFGPPVVTTSPATAISSGGAQLNGLVNPNGVETLTWFEWAEETTNYANSTPARSAGAGEFPLNEGVTVGFFNPDATYHYRVVASNALGQAYGADESFKWDDTEPHMISVRPGDGRAREIRLSGVPRQVYWIQASLDMGEWIFIGTAVEQASGEFEFTDPNNQFLPHRYYRGFAP